MRPPRRLALFAPLPPFPPNFYLDVLFGMKRGFEALGTETYVGTSLLPADVLNVFCRHFQPDAILEINRSRTPLPTLPKEVAHVAWLQDFRFDGKMVTDEASQSEITYFVIDPEFMGHTLKAKGLSGLLFPGADPTVYFAEEREAESDFSFVGYIPSPFTKEVWNTSLLRHDTTGKSLTVGELVTALSTREEFRHANFDYRKVRGCVTRAFEEFLGGPVGVPLPDAIMSLFDDVLLRMLDRKSLIDAVLRVSTSLRLFGPQDWGRWPEYKPYYQGYVENVHEIRKIYQTTRVNLHNGRLGQHFRVLDCMAAGGLILVNESIHENAPGGIRQIFEPGVHYVPYTFANITEVASKWLADEAGRRRIREQAVSAVMARHTWKHRAQQILDDLARI